jgi:hypothetical protein
VVTVDSHVIAESSCLKQVGSYNRGKFNPKSMKSKVPRTWLAAILVGLVAVCFISVTGWLLASPSEEITRAVQASGKKEVKQAAADTFLDAFSSVLITVPQKESAPYVAAATKMRPDLKDGIKGTAEDVYGAAKDTDETDRRRVSRHRRKVPICCHGHTIFLPPQQVEHYLEQHPECTRGACP